MSLPQWHVFSFVLAFFFMGLAVVIEGNVPTAYRTIFVDPSSSSQGGNFSTIQSAIDSIPMNNMSWICIYIKAGLYREQVKIPYGKSFIYLKGEGKKKTTVVWGAHDSIETSATFTTEADNIVAKSLTFVNSYNYPSTSSANPRMPAVAAMIWGDKSAFYECGFMGLQDTLWDLQGRHLFKRCTIEGAVDFIFGAGQSLYEDCTIFVRGSELDGLAGFITAQGRSKPNDSNGFVFNNCNVIGTGKAFLGRPWRDFARVIFYNTSMSDVIAPQGWSPWQCLGREYQLTFVEQNCHGLGSNTSQRVSWENKLSEEALSWLTSMSFIDNEGWISRQAFKM